MDGMAIRARPLRKTVGNHSFELFCFCNMFNVVLNTKCSKCSE